MDDRFHCVSGSIADHGQVRLSFLPIAVKVRLNTCFSFMDILWQYNNPPNPSDAAIGPQAYDHHLYYRLVQVPFCVPSSCKLMDVFFL
jgi:hypothetical protein